MGKRLIFICMLMQALFASAKKSDFAEFLGDCNSCCEGYLVFTAPDMNKDGQNPDTSFSGVYDNSNFNIQAWRMKPSGEGQQEISLMFGMPGNYESTCSLEITFYLLVEKNAGSQGNSAAIRIQSDHKETNQEIGPNFSSLDTTESFVIVEPSNNKSLEFISVSTVLNSTGIAPKDWVLFVFDRVAPADGMEEYNKNIYLAGVVIKYGARLC